jgi:hypothetical protein
LDDEINQASLELSNVFKYYHDVRRPTPGELYYPAHLYDNSDDVIAQARYTIFDLPNWLHIGFILE